MYPRTNPVAGVLAAVLALALAPMLQPGPAGRLASPGTGTGSVTAVPTAVPAGGPNRYSVTLVTGDRVTWTGPAGSTANLVVTPGRGRERMRFAQFTAAGHRYVIPQDALRPLGSGRLDRRLFDLTLLRELGYHDPGGLPLIVSYAPGTPIGTPALRTGGATLSRDLPAINGAAVTVGGNPAAVWAALVHEPGTDRAELAAGIAHVWLDGRRQPATDLSAARTGVPAVPAVPAVPTVPTTAGPATATAGYTGAGVTVAVLDTGIDATHPDLAGKVLAERNFTADGDPADLIGHGTHVASIVAGTGAASAGRYRGVAPEATLYDGKVCDIYGCSDSAILAGMQWAAAEMHARVVNMSLGIPDGPDLDPLELAVNSLTASYGTLFVIGAGNDGPAAGTVGSPGSADRALTVGAVDATGRLASFSSQGPRVGDDAVKPDLTAPGVAIVAARATGTHAGTPVGDYYTTLSGTSMATPYVAGAAAVLLQQYPQWTAGQVKADLMASAAPNPSATGYQQGAGQVDLARAGIEPVTSDPTTVSLGRQYWPHPDDAPVVWTLTYHNSGGTDLTLDLTLAVSGPGGVAPPGGMFTVSANSVTVPAGGEAPVTVTADTTIAGPDGLYSGQLLASSGGVRVSTPIGINKEVESYDLALSHVDRTGAPATGYVTVVTGADGRPGPLLFGPAGTATARLPKGRYDLGSIVTSPDGSSTLLTRPVLDLDADTTIRLDARTARPIQVMVPDPAARVLVVDVGYGHGGAAMDIVTDSFDAVFVGGTGPAGAAATGPRYVTYVSSQWAKPGADGTVPDGADFYAVAGYRYDQPYQGFQRHYRWGDLARVRSRYHRVVADLAGAATMFPNLPGGLVGMPVTLPVTAPGGRTEYYSTQPGVAWSGYLDLASPAGASFLFSSPRSWRPGQDATQQWNQGPFLPAFPAIAQEGSYVSRFNDLILVNVPLFGDRAGNGGDADVDSGATTLYRDGQIVDQFPDPGFGEFPVPAATGTYRLVAEATRSGYTDLSTSIRCEWTFPSGHGPDGVFTALPVFVVRPTPELANNSARAGTPLEVPLQVSYQPGAPAGSVRSMSVAVSTDDGTTWQPAAAHNGPAGWSVTLVQPRAAGYVSLRISAVDFGGNSVEEMIIHAYRLIVN